MTREKILLYLISRSGKSPERLVGRKKLMKLAFFGEHFDPESGSLTPEPQLGEFGFEIYKYGPFSKDVLDAYDELESTGYIEEDDQNYLHTIIKVQEERTDSIEHLMEEFDPETRQQLEAVVDHFGGDSGSTLESTSLEMLNIDKSEKDQFRGIPMNQLIQERAT